MTTPGKLSPALITSTVPPIISAPSLNSLALDLLTALGAVFVGIERVCRLTRGLREAFEDDSLEEDEIEEA